MLIITILISILIPVNSYSDMWKNYTVKDGLINNSVLSIAVDNDSVWFGTKKGLSRYIKKQNVWKNFTTKEGLIPDEIVALSVSGNNIWIGTKNGLCVYNKDSKEFRTLRTKDGLPSNVITSLLTTPDEIWIGTDCGISVYNKSSGSFTNYTTADGLYRNTITSIISDGSNILAGTHGSAINVFNKLKKTWALYSPSSPMYTNIVLTTQGENVWSGTNGGGIRIFNKQTKKWLAFKKNDGLGDENLSSIISDGIYIWCGTFDGISYFNIETKSWKVYNAKDGLIDAPITAIVVDGNFIWFGTDNGVTRFNKIVPEVSISTNKSFITSQDKPVDIDCTVSSYNEIKNFKIEYSTFTFPDIWMNKGIKITTDQDKLYAVWDLNDIPSKTDFYNLKLTASDMNGNVNSASCSLIIDTVPPVVTIKKEKDEAPVGIFTINGTFNKTKIEKIIANPGNIPAILNTNSKTYYAIVNLKEGDNNITVTAYDWIDRVATASAKFTGKKSGAETTIQIAQNTEGSSESKLIIGEKMLFDTGSAELKSSVYPTLDKIIDILKKYSDSSVKIEGHTDNTPIRSGSNYPTNMELSLARAKNVFLYFVKKGGIPVERMKIKGYGDLKPIATNETEEGKSLNRRVEIIITGPEQK